MICRNPSSKRTSIRRRHRGPTSASSTKVEDPPVLPTLGTGIAVGGGIPGGTRLRQPGEALSGPPVQEGEDQSVKPPSLWERFARIITAPILPMVLINVGGMQDPAVQQAWREKVALCFLILLISTIFGFFTFGLSVALCHPSPGLSRVQVREEHGLSAESPSERFMIIRGQIYQTGGYFSRGEHPSSQATLQSILNPLYGQDITPLFPVDRLASECNRWPSENVCDFTGTSMEGNTPGGLYHCHVSPGAKEALDGLKLSRVTYSWKEVKASDSLFTYDTGVYDLGPYLRTLKNDSTTGYLGGPEVTMALRELIGKDGSWKVSTSKVLKEIIPCVKDQFLVGSVEGTTIGCVTTNAIVAIAMAMLGCITLIKFISAVAFAWVLSRSLGRISSKPRDPSSRSHIFLLVTAYSEDEVGLRTTFDSMARTDYPEDHKVLFVIADGNVTGSGNDKSTPELCLDLMDRSFSKPKPSPSPSSPYSNFTSSPFYQGKGSPESGGSWRDNEDIPLTYPSVGQGEKTVNQAKVYTGHYVTPDGLHRIPYVLVWKCGLDSERQAGGGEKAGNRGKRDSQLILMRWLSRVCFNQRLSPLEYALFERVTRLGGGVTPDRYEMVLMVDADTLVMPDSVKYMVAAMERDPLVMGLCGETRISNKSQSWVTMIQVSKITFLSSEWVRIHLS